MMRIYIAGPMTGLTDYNFPAFNEVATTLRKVGYGVENPAENKNPDPADWEACMRTAITQMLRCDTVIFLQGWENSRGAKLEHSIAGALDMTMLEWDPDVCRIFKENLSRIL